MSLTPKIKLKPNVVQDHTLERAQDSIMHTYVHVLHIQVSMCTNVWATTYTEIGYVCMAASGIFQIDQCALWLRAGCAGAASVTLAVHFFPGVVGLLGHTIAPCGPGILLTHANSVCWVSGFVTITCCMSPACVPTSGPRQSYAGAWAGQLLVIMLWAS